MTTRFWWCVCAAGLVGTVAAMPLGCKSSDESTTQTTTTTQTGTHSGGHGGTGATGGGGQGASGGTGGAGGASAVEAFCDNQCPLAVECGQGGGGGASGWPPDLEGCLTGCLQIWGDCDAAALTAAQGCIAPHIDPDCDLDAFWACITALGTVDCAQQPGSG